MRIFTLLLLSLIILGCSATQNASKIKKCSKAYKNDFSEILNEKHTTIVDNDTVSYNELRYQCVHTAFYTQKVMFDTFGKWHKEIYPMGKKSPLLKWENITLFSDKKKYTVIAYGRESTEETFTSVLVFDENENDVLENDSDEKEKIAQFFGDLIHNNDVNKKVFYETYWKAVDPNHWKTIQIYRAMKIN